MKRIIRVGSIHASLLTFSLLIACSPLQHSATESASTAQLGDVPPMPIAISNNAVASVLIEGTPMLYSFFGLTSGKTHRDITRTALEYSAASKAWKRLPDVPVAQGRLASVAAVASGQIYLFGGYTVAGDGSEVSTSEVLRFDPVRHRYTQVAAMPTPVDDSVALVHNDRHIYLVSGWHQDKNVALVQIYDTQTNQWSRATDFPGTPVFGHAGAIMGDQFLVCDGVRLDIVQGKRNFSASAECWHADIDADNVSHITWTRAVNHAGAPRYRMGASADAKRKALLFAGGSSNPYNFNGIGYNGTPSPASAQVDAFDLASKQWRKLPNLSHPSMDHRGLLPSGDSFYLVGGMREGQAISNEVLRYP
jgi:N-acetylneuraminic acid mutarotase